MTMAMNKIKSILAMNEVVFNIDNENAAQFSQATYLHCTAIDFSGNA